MVLIRSGRELQSATRPFVEVSRRASWWYVSSTLALLTASLALAGLAPWWPIQLMSSVLGGLIMARAFILYHDFMHGSILRGSRPAKVMLHGLGLLMLVPPRSWRESHNYHHANVAKLNAPAIGSYPIMTTTEWRHASRRQRFFYRMSRHPLTILFAYLTIFGFTITISPLLKYTALFSNTARAHQLNKTSEWVVIYYDRGDGERQCTVITATHGPQTGKRIVRGREEECLAYYSHITESGESHLRRAA